jgi:hypothetical protein
MATQTGECEINSIEGNVVKGSYKSVYDKNVGTANKTTAAMILYDAFSSLVGKEVPEKALEAAIIKVSYDTPNKQKTKFTIEVSDPAILDGLTTGYWESYYVG